MQSQCKHLVVTCQQNRTMAKCAAWVPSSLAVCEGHRLGEKQKAVDTRQGLAKSEQNVSYACIRIAARRSGVQNV